MRDSQPCKDLGEGYFEHKTHQTAKSLKGRAGKGKVADVNRGRRDTRCGWRDSSGCVDTEPAKSRVGGMLDLIPSHEERHGVIWLLFSKLH